MKIAILGSGGREHAITHAISESKKTTKVYCMPGNAGTEYIAKNINVDLNNFQQIYEFIKSDMTDKIAEEHTELLKSKISLNKFGEPKDVANTIVFLSSSLSDYITGETVHVNGGMYFS